MTLQIPESVLVRTHRYVGAILRSPFTSHRKGRWKRWQHVEVVALRVIARGRQSFGYLSPLNRLVWLFVLLSAATVARAEDAYRSLPCEKASLSASDLEANVAANEADLKEVKAALATAPADEGAKAKLSARLEEIQAALLELTFARQCVTTFARPEDLRAEGQEAKWIEVTTYFATTRAPTGSSDPQNFFGGDRNIAAKDNKTFLQYGKTVVSLPTTRKPGDLNLPVWWKFELSPDPSKHFVLKSVLPMATDLIKADMSQTLAKSTSKSLLVFVHGFNNTFFDATLRTAQLSVDLKFPGAAILFSWPSAGIPAKYAHDEEAEGLSDAAFDAFLDDIAASGADEVVLVAHSMGNRLVTRVLAARAARDALPPNLKTLLMAAPDINADSFRQDLVPALARLRMQKTIYASSSDVALRASAYVHDFHRVGETTGGVLTFPGFETIDASGVAPMLRGFGHSYVVDSVKVLVDMSETIFLHEDADARGLPFSGAPPVRWWLLK